MSKKKKIISGLVVVVVVVLAAVVFSSEFNPSRQWCLGVGLENPKIKDVCGYQAQKNPEACAQFDPKNPDPALAELCGLDSCVMPFSYPDEKVCYGLPLDL